MKRLMKASAALLAVGTVAFAAVACYDAPDPTTPPTTTTPAPTQTVAPTATVTPTETLAPTGTATQPVSNEIVVDLKDNFFEPKDFTIPANTTVTIVAKNVGSAIHNMHVLSAASEGKDFASDTVVAAGTESRFEVTFTKTGTIQFQCDFHVPDMVGTITVQ